MEADRTSSIQSMYLPITLQYMIKCFFSSSFTGFFLVFQCEYREGVSKGRTDAFQTGFDDGYKIGYELGEILGKIEGFVFISRSR